MFYVLLLLACVLCWLDKSMSEEKCRETLLKKKKYYENCFGCKVDKLKEVKQSLPIREIISLWFVAVCN
ncbi:hypothetical protein Pint_05489 [Pistacia integerrima]|uniref:Uncharacterized protein n=1 Tax=Pistacia integerrima TaxID=434235 RepID=A0ACC0Z7M1_9ROSI|nr:hypothetical protein Pint_05489 [Pistacia integerrima]